MLMRDFFLHIDDSLSMIMNYSISGMFPVKHIWEISIKSGVGLGRDSCFYILDVYIINFFFTHIA